MFVVRLKSKGKFWSPKLDFKIEGDEEKEIPDELLKKHPELFDLVGQGTVFTEPKGNVKTIPDKNDAELIKKLSKVLEKAITNSKPHRSVPKKPSKNPKIKHIIKPIIKPQITVKNEEPTSQEKEAYWKKRREVIEKSELFKAPSLNKISTSANEQVKVDRLFRKIGFKK